jgi:hypothetical protein
MRMDGLRRFLGSQLSAAASSCVLIAGAGDGFQPYPPLSL